MNQDFIGAPILETTMTLPNPRVLKIPVLTWEAFRELRCSLTKRWLISQQPACVCSHNHCLNREGQTGAWVHLERLAKREARPPPHPSSRLPFHPAAHFRGSRFDFHGWAGEVFSLSTSHWFPPPISSSSSSSLIHSSQLPQGGGGGVGGAPALPVSHLWKH